MAEIYPCDIQRSKLRHHFIIGIEKLECVNLVARALAKLGLGFVSPSVFYPILTEGYVKTARVALVVQPSCMYN